MSNIVQNTDYSTNLTLLLEQYKNSTKLKALIDSANISANYIEQALFEIQDEYYLEIAVGDQLDVIGTIFSVDRDGLSDTDYRAKIKTRTSLIGSGEPEFIIAALQALYMATYVNYSNGFPAGFYIDTDAVVTLPQIRILSPAGVEPAFLGFLELTTRDGYLTQTLPTDKFKIGLTRQYFSDNWVLTNTTDNFTDTSGNNLLIFE